MTRSAWVMAISVAAAILGGFGLYLAGAKIDSVTLGLRWSLCFAGLGFILNCWVPCDHVPVRSWALFKAKDVLRELIRTLKAEQSVVKVV